RDIEPVEFGDEERGASSRYRRRARQAPMAGLALFEHIDDAFTAAHVNPTALGVDEHIVSIAAGFELGRYASVPARKRHQCWRAAKDDEDPLRVTIDRHWEIGLQISGRQGSVRRGREI